MSLLLHILRKDVRQLRPEIATFVGILVIHTAIEPGSWGGPPGAIQAGLPSLLFYFALAILTLRVVQTERLAGLNQFWTTRPYEWPKLFVAKALFLLLTAYLPLALSQMDLLWRAHLPVLTSLPALLLNLLLLTAFAVAPVACIAALTRSLAQAAPAVVGLLVVYAAAANATFRDQRLAPTGLLGWQTGIWGSCLAIALLMQYSRRRTVRSLAVIAIAPVVLLISEAVWVGTPLAVAGYLPAGDDAPVALQLQDGSYRSQRQNGVPIFEPQLRTEHATLGKIFSSEAMRVTLTNSDGYSWQAPWIKWDSTYYQSDPDHFESTHGSQGFGGLVLPRQVVGRLGDGPVSVRVELAMDELEEAPLPRSTVSAQGESIPGLGFCTQGVNSFGPPNTWFLDCRTAFRRRSFSIDTSVPKSSCGGPSTSESLQPFHAEIRTIEDWPMAPKISPVDEWQSYNSTDPPTSAPCPGTPIAFSVTQVARRMLVEVPEKTTRLTDFMDASR